MVIQADMPAPLWGWAQPGESVLVAINGQQVLSEADATGKWHVKLEPMSHGGPYELTITGANTIAISNVAVGEIWLASGQSNMQWIVADCANPEEELGASDYPMIREFTTERIHRSAPQENMNGEWFVSGRATTGQFSAVGYYFARYLHRELGVPVGIINSSWGGSMCIPWMRRQDLEGDPDLAPYLDNIVEAIDAYPGVQQHYEKLLAAYAEEYEAAHAAGEPLPPVPELPPGYPTRAATGMWNAMIHPLVPYAMRGAIWYQGESDAVLDLALLYRKTFSTMISGWREAWGQGDFPFLFVQLANFNTDTNWPVLREAQLQTLSLPNTAMAVTIDIGDAIDIHPKNKQDVGYRLGLAARAAAYGEDLVFSGPIYSGMTVEGDAIRLAFEHTGGGLVAKDGKPLVGFEIAAGDRRFVPAAARIDGHTVVVGSPDVSTPAAVRYAWANNPACNLCNAEGLPACPFRTDDWEP